MLPLKALKKYFSNTINTKEEAHGKIKIKLRYVVFKNRF